MAGNFNLFHDHHIFLTIYEHVIRCMIKNANKICTQKKNNNQARCFGKQFALIYTYENINVTVEIIPRRNNMLITIQNIQYSCKIYNKLQNSKN